MTFLQKHAAKGQIVTGLLYVDPDSEDHALPSRHGRDRRSTRWRQATSAPASTALEKINASLR